MFIPKIYQQKDFTLVRQLIKECPLATVMVATNDGTEACHIPLYCQDDGSEYGLLCGHVGKIPPRKVLELSST